MSDLNPEVVNKLIEDAIKARTGAYAVYSNFKVGAALLTREGSIYGGCNIENVSFTPTVCAERVAFFKAVSEGIYNFKAIAIVSGDGTPTPPCGVCRQVMAEFVENDFIIILSTESGKIISYNFSELFPLKFVPQAPIGKQNVWDALKSVIQADNSISEDEYQLVSTIMADMEKFDHQIAFFVNNGKLSEEETDRISQFRQKVYSSAVQVANQDDFISDDERAILKKLADLLEIQ